MGTNLDSHSFMCNHPCAHICSFTSLAKIFSVCVCISDVRHRSTCHIHFSEHVLFNGQINYLGAHLQCPHGPPGEPGPQVESHWVSVYTTDLWLGHQHWIVYTPPSCSKADRSSGISVAYQVLIYVWGLNVPMYSATWETVLVNTIFPGRTKWKIVYLVNKDR